MADRYEASGYWGPRKESLGHCAARLSAFLTRLSACAEELSQWYETGWSTQDALRRPVTIRDRSRLVDMIKRGANRRDTDGGVIPELGFDVALWNGRDGGHAAGLSISSGLFTRRSGIVNSVVLELPEGLIGAGMAHRAREILSCLVRCWEPDWAEIHSTEASRVCPFDAHIPLVDWMVFVSRKVRQVRAIPPPSSLVRIDDLGCLIVVQDEPVRTGSSADMANVRRVQRALGITEWKAAPPAAGWHGG